LLLLCHWLLLHSAKREPRYHRGSVVDDRSGSANALGLGRSLTHADKRSCGRMFLRSGEPQRKLPRRAGIELDELREGTGQLSAIKIGASLELRRELVRHVARPTLARVERDHSEWVVKLAAVEVLKGGLAIALLGIGLAIDPAWFAEIIFNDVDRVVF
jgi:hypothetical protein